MDKTTIKSMAGKIAIEQREAVKRAQRAYAITKAFNETNKQIDAEARAEALAAFNYPFDPEHKRCETLPEFCKDPKIDYLIDKKFWDEYFQNVYDRRVKKGWPVPQYKVEPYYHVSADADSFSLLKMAEKVLIDAGLEVLPADMRKDLERARQYPHSEKLIEIIMKWDTSK